jgi:L-asparagine oxygenase
VDRVRPEEAGSAARGGGGGAHAPQRLSRCFSTRRRTQRIPSVAFPPFSNIETDMIQLHPIEPFAAVWRLGEQERDRLLAALLGIGTSPYRDFEGFLAELAALRPATLFFTETLARMRAETDLDQRPMLYLRNLPLEKTLPVFGHDDPVADKYAMKTTFVTEAVLALLADAIGTPIVGYRTINNGDMFHDVYLKESLKHTASQKSMVSFGFHYDMGFKKLRPDWANLACLRSASANCVSTSVCRNIDILAALSPSELDILATPMFATPEEVVSQMGGAAGSATALRPVYFPHTPWKFEYFEGRTDTADARGAAVLRKLDTVLHRHKRHLVLEPGDLAAISNNHATHCREVMHIGDLNAHRTRWLVKTYNVEAQRAGAMRTADE